jgi:hypothetical protein
MVMIRSNGITKTPFWLKADEFGHGLILWQRQGKFYRIHTAHESFSIASATEKAIVELPQIFDSLKVIEGRNKNALTPLTFGDELDASLYNLGFTTERSKIFSLVKGVMSFSFLRMRLRPSRSFMHPWPHYFMINF